MDPSAADPNTPSFPTPSSVTDTAPSPTPAEASPTRSAGVPPVPVSIKQEPRSPVHVNAQLEAAHAHSTTSDPHTAPATGALSRDGNHSLRVDPRLHLVHVSSLLDPALSSHPSPKRKPELQSTTGYNWENFGDSADIKEGASPEMVEKAVQATRDGVAALPDVKPSYEVLSQIRRDLEGRSAADCAATHSFASPLNMPASPSETKNGKRVRKLKKRKMLKKSPGTEPPESSDTELDGEALRPRWLRSRRRLSGGSQVSTSTQPSEDRDADVSMEVGEEAPRPLPQSVRQEKTKTDFRPPKPVVELSLNLDSEESMEVTAACQHPHMDTLVPAAPAQVPDPSRPESQSLACNEVTSTSDMDVCKSSER